MVEQIDEAMCFFENEIKQCNIKLNGELRDEYREYIEKLVSHYEIALYALNELLE